MSTDKMSSRQHKQYIIDICNAMQELMSDEEALQEYLTENEIDETQYLRDVAKTCEELWVNLPL